MKLDSEDGGPCLTLANGMAATLSEVKTIFSLSKQLSLSLSLSLNDKAIITTGSYITFGKRKEYSMKVTHKFNRLIFTEWTILPPRAN